MQAERKPRKSVQFEDSTIIVDSDGQVTEGGAMNGDKDSAASHATGTSASPHYNGGNGSNLQETGEDKEVEEVTDMFAGLAKKVRPCRISS